MTLWDYLWELRPCDSAWYFLIQKDSRAKIMYGYLLLTCSRAITCRCCKECTSLDFAFYTFGLCTETESDIFSSHALLCTVGNIYKIRCDCVYRVSFLQTFDKILSCELLCTGCLHGPGLHPQSLCIFTVSWKFRCTSILMFKKILKQVTGCWLLATQITDLTDLDKEKRKV